MASGFRSEAFSSVMSDSRTDDFNRSGIQARHAGTASLFESFNYSSSQTPKTSHGIMTPSKLHVDSELHLECPNRESVVSLEDKGGLSRSNEVQSAVKLPFCVGNSSVPVTTTTTGVSDCHNSKQDYGCEDDKPKSQYVEKLVLKSLCNVESLELIESEADSPRVVHLKCSHRKHQKVDANNESMNSNVSEGKQHHFASADVDIQEDDETLSSVQDVSNGCLAALLIYEDSMPRISSDETESKLSNTSLSGRRSTDLSSKTSLEVLQVVGSNFSSVAHDNIIKMPLVSNVNQCKKI